MLSGPLGTAISGVVGAVLAVLAAVGITNAVNGSPSPVDQPYVQYGSSAPTK